MNHNRNILQFIVLPLIFLTVTLLGGLRIAKNSGAFLFFKPVLMTMILALMLLILLVKSGIVNIKDWFSTDAPFLQNLANGLTFFTIFTASVQIFNSILPEKGLFFGVMTFFFLWTLWTNLFADFVAEKLLRSLAAIFGFAFIFKWIFLSNLSFKTEGWASKLVGLLIEGVSPISFELPSFAETSGFISFFTLLIFTLGLFLAKNLSPNLTKEVSDSE